jgi:general secretion pathway protein E/type IV pilus assembly protein PilB
MMTGPTGSGKTTTLYTILSYINSIDKNIMTLEDPVEYHIPMIRQSNIKNDVGMDFASGIKSILRQDPDVILVGEIRDKETAITTIQAAMTGHQVYSSLHTNDALGVVPRLMNIGVPSYLISGSIICAIAQRLARKICSHCKVRVPISTSDHRIIGEKHHDVKTLCQGRGCDRCEGSGYKGRLAIIEILPFDRDLDELIMNEVSRKEMYNHIMSKGFVPMIEDGIDKVVQGMTDMKELIRVVDMTERMDI